MNLDQYIEIVDKRFKSGISREHSYRSDLEGLIRELVPGVDITNEPANVTDCGNPDYVITKGKIPIGFIEAKDVGKDLNGSQFKEQFGRYRKALDNLIITDYLWFLFFQNGELVADIRIGEINVDGAAVRAATENFEQFSNLLQDFCTFISQTIKSPKKLAEMMAGKARLLENILEQAITSDEESSDNTSLKQQYQTFKNILIHDLTPQGFADIYAQTLAYGMFAARLHDKTLDTFSRQEATELIPKTNPFLRKLFNHVAGVDIDERIKTTVDNLAEVFRATNIEELLKNFGKSTQKQDPIIHFYETFLAAYDSKLRKARGVWYTPEPVVNFIVRGVDEILKTEFGLKDGLADTSKTKIKVQTDQPDRRTKSGYVEIEKEAHKVQILDPATGTGTFLAEVIKFIYNGKFQTMQGAWSGYVEEHLIPRLNGFELLMASYAMAHLKLDILLAETGYQPKKEQRFNIYLTNSLEEHHPDTGTLFASWLSAEANEANHIKRDSPVMVALGNPPYSGESSNKGDWIRNLVNEAYLYKDGVRLDEKGKKNWLQDDYVKFLRYGQYLIEKNNKGILAFINNNGFLDNPTFRFMRWHLLKTFDAIYLIDLHGSTKKKETAPDGGKDENVFDIQLGVSINIFVKTGKKRKGSPAEVFHYDLYGKREEKYKFLWNKSLSEIDFEILPATEPKYYFAQQNMAAQQEYQKGFSVTEIFPVSGAGVITSRDHFIVCEEKDTLKNRLLEFSDLSISDDEIRHKYDLKDNSMWSLTEARKNFNKHKIEDKLFVKINYRPFDERWLYYQTDVLFNMRTQITKHFLNGNNLGICINRRIEQQRPFADTFLFKTIIQHHSLSIKEVNTVAPLYLYPGTGGQLALGVREERQPNLNMEIVGRIAEGLSLDFTPEKEEREGTFTPIDLLDYIYAVLHSPNYREKYKELLKIDFPRVPYPDNVEKFWRLVTLGGELRKIHLLESPVVEKFITTYPIDGDNRVTRKMTKKSIGYEPDTKETGRVWINDEQYFDNVPLVAWEFFIGSYQPAQKWLKDRNATMLSYENIQHYQKIIVVLVETNRLMNELDKISFENDKILGK